MACIRRHKAGPEGAHVVSVSKEDVRCCLCSAIWINWWACMCCCSEEPCMQSDTKHADWRQTVYRRCSGASEINNQPGIFSCNERSNRWKAWKALAISRPRAPRPKYKGNFTSHWRMLALWHASFVCNTSHMLLFAALFLNRPGPTTDCIIGNRQVVPRLCGLAMCSVKRDFGDVQSLWSRKPMGRPMGD